MLLQDGIELQSCAGHSSLRYGFPPCASCSYSDPMENDWSVVYGSIDKKMVLFFFLLVYLLHAPVCAWWLFLSSLTLIDGFYLCKPVTRFYLYVFHHGAV